MQAYRASEISLVGVLGRRGSSVSKALQGLLVCPGLDGEVGLGAESDAENDDGEEPGEVVGELPVLPFPRLARWGRGACEGVAVRTLLGAWARPSTRSLSTSPRAKGRFQSAPKHPSCRCQTSRRHTLLHSYRCRERGNRGREKALLFVIGIGKKKRVRERRKKVVEGKKEVDGLMREIGRQRHENVVALRAYYFSKDEILLVYDFMPNGSLHSMLHGNRGPGRTPLDWSTRLKLAAGAARGLAFLHHACESKRAHGHLTSSNILVDQEGNACISDFALDQLVHPSPPLSSSSPNKAYKAPELVDNTTSTSSKASQKSDVYSFGIVLLEILTGKMAGEGEGEGMDLVKWVRSNAAQEDSILEVFDLELLRYKEMEVEMVALLQVALLCLNHMPRERPKMSVVYKMIEDIRARGAGGGSVVHSPSPNDLSSNSSPCLSEDTPTVASS